MHTHLTTTASPTEAILIPAGADKHARYRLGKFTNWMEGQRRPWHAPDLRAYRDHLLAEDYAPSTVSAHLSTIRSRYRSILRDNRTRDALYDLARRGLQGAGQGQSAVARKAFVDELTTRIENAVDPANAPVRVRTSQDRPDSVHLRLTKEQADALLASPGTDGMPGLRDTAVIALMLCTGIREAELSNLEVRDLRRRLGGELALHVREGKGCKERLVPYGELDWVLVIVDAWRRAAGVERGPAFRGFYKGYKTARPGPLSVRAIQYILERYPIAIGGELVAVKPHDLRRTYARRLYEVGMDPIEIQQNLGHADLKTTLGYIGTLDADQRRPPAVYTFDLASLYRQGALEGCDRRE